MKNLKKYQSEKQQRSISIDRTRDIDEEKRTVSVAFSSEDAYLRYFGYEILDHSPASIRLGRLQDGGPVLVDHDTRDHVGVIENVSIDKDRRGRAKLRFGRGERASEIFNDVLDGIRTSISVGYRVHEMVLENRSDDSDDTYRVTDWEPLEVSFVAVPADATVGVGKSLCEEGKMPEEIKTTEVETKPAAHAAPAVHIPEVDVAAVQRDARSSELTRIRNIGEIAKDFGYADLGEEHVSKGTNVDQFRQVLLAKMTEDNGRKPGAVPEIGLSEKDVNQYSVVRALAAMANPENRQLRAAAAFEFEVSSAAAEAAGSRAQGLMIPPEVFSRDLNAVTGAATQGGHTVATELGSLIDMLRNRSVISQIGATMLTGLEGNIALPRQTSGATGYWVAESGAPTESQQAFDQVALTPKTFGAFTEYTRQLLLQSSIDVESFVRNDLASVLALGIDLAALYGSGASNQPTGISNQSGINAPSSFAAANPTFGEIVTLESDLAVDNADVGSLAYAMKPDMRGYCKSTEKFSGTGQTIWEAGNTVNGYNVGVSNQVTAGDLFFGNWSDLFIGMWGGLDIMVNPYALDTSGGVRITALQSVDIAVRHPESFAFNNDGA